MRSNVRPGDGRKVGILGVPLGYGAGQAGSELGVGAMRLSRMRGGVLSEHIRKRGYDVQDYGDVDVIRSLEVAAVSTNPKYLPEMLASSKNIVNDMRRILADGA